MGGREQCSKSEDRFSLDLGVLREKVVLDWHSLWYMVQERVSRMQGYIHLVFIIHLDSPCGSWEYFFLHSTGLLSELHPDCGLLETWGFFGSVHILVPPSWGNWEL
jgi:hypothetical protein